MTTTALFVVSTRLHFPHSPIRHTCCHSPTMCSKGFGKPPPSRQPTPNQQRRSAASKRYDEMSSAGMPEYTIWMRLKTGGVLSENIQQENEEAEVMPWLPVGCIAVPRSGSVAKALFGAQDDLWQGAERLYPKLKGENRNNVEFGCQLRQFPDEEIRLVEVVQEQGVEGWMKRFWRRLQNPMNVA